MHAKLQQFIAQEKLFDTHHRLLLAVSGGIDSMVLCALLYEMEVNFGIAHCNFQLRESDSELDAQFVCATAARMNIPYFQKNFDTKVLLQQHSKENTQSLARQLRYTWFDELLVEHGYDFLVTAHHQNDLVETVLLKLTKGTGVRGLRGILPKRNQIIRPLLCFSKKEIIQFAEKNQVAFRADSSNATDVYQRNYLRHHVLPLLENINSKAIQNIARSSNYFRDLEQLLQAKLEHCRQQYLQVQNGVIIIDYNAFQQEVAFSTLLYEMLLPYGFHQDQVEQIRSTFPSNGKQFFSKTHQILIHQHQLHIRLIPTKNISEYLIKAQQNTLNIATNQLTIKQFDINKFNKNSNPFTIFLDADTVHFPLGLRKWNHGDWFCPLGMQGKRQKLKAYFSNHKMSIYEKEATWILESNGHICWLIGHRIDERFKVTENTKQVLQISWH